MTRSDAIAQVVAMCRKRLLAGLPQNWAAIQQAYPELMPELGPALERLSADTPTAPLPPTEPSATHAARPACPFAAQLEPYLDGSLSADERLRVEQHVRSCAECRDELEFRRDFEVLFDSLDGEPFPPPPLPNIRIPNHEFVRWLGRGGCGDVWLARHVTIGEPRAIKLVPLPHHDPTALARYLQEAQIIGALGRTRNRVVLHDCFPQDGCLVLIMEYLAGGPLSQTTSPSSPLPWERASRYIVGVAQELVEVHRRGVLHRDIKPSNILLDEARREAFLSDFGLAAFVADAGDLVGTAGYIAPELWGGVATGRSDVFSLAATLFCLVTGLPPFPPEDPLEALRLAAAGLQAPVRALGRVPQAVEQVILAGLEPDPQQRLDPPAFIEQLTAAHLQSQADQLARQDQPSAVELAVEVLAKRPDEAEFHSLPWTIPALEPHRTGAAVPVPSPLARVHTDDVLRLRTTVNADGYLTVLNLSSSGEVAVMFPNVFIRAGKHHLSHVQLVAPAGTERFPVIWTRQRVERTPEEWEQWIMSGGHLDAPPPSASRGGLPLGQCLEGEPVGEYRVRVWTIVHHPADRGTHLHGTSRGCFDREVARRDAGTDIAFTEASRSASAADAPGAPAGPVLPAELATLRRQDEGPSALDPVACSVFAPPAVARGTSVMVQVFVHLPPLAAEADQLAAQFDDEATRRAPPRNLQAGIPRGERLFFELTLPGLEVDDPLQSLVWTGQTEAVQFEVAATDGCPKASVIGTLRVSLGEHHIPVGHVKFKLAVTGEEYRDVAFRAGLAGQSAQRYRKAFVSYASSDRREVLKRVQMLEALRLEFFQDVLDLSPGERWEQALYRHIDDCDLFLLFWSSAAKQSPWVLQEVDYAQRRKQGDDCRPPEILPVILEGPPPVQPPGNLRHLHFNSRLIYFAI